MEKVKELLHGASVTLSREKYQCKPVTSATPYVLSCACMYMGLYLCIWVCVWEDMGLYLCACVQCLGQLTFCDPLLLLLLLFVTMAT